MLLSQSELYHGTEASQSGHTHSQLSDTENSTDWKLAAAACTERIKLNSTAVNCTKQSEHVHTT